MPASLASQQLHVEITAISQCLLMPACDLTRACRSHGAFKRGQQRRTTNVSCRSCQRCCRGCQIQRLPTRLSCSGRCTLCCMQRLPRPRHLSQRLPKHLTLMMFLWWECSVHIVWRIAMVNAASRYSGLQSTPPLQIMNSRRQTPCQASRRVLLAGSKHSVTVQTEC